MKISRSMWYNIVFIKKMLVTIFIVLVLLLGQHLPLPFVESTDFYSSQTDWFSFTSSLSGGDLSKISIFSLGVSPYMMAMLFWRLFRINADNDKSAIHLTDRRIKSLTLLIATIQAFAVAINIDYTLSFDSEWLFLLNLIFPTMLTMVAGSFVVVWLGNLNVKYGIGGITIIVFINMVHQLISQLSQSNLNHWLVTLAFVIFSALVILFTIISEKSEYRIKINHPGIYHHTAEVSYLPIKVNSAGGLPIMYAMLLLMIPQYIILGLNYFTANDLRESDWLINFSTYRMSGIALYLILVFALTVIFSFFNIDPRRLARQMRKEGDYIDQVRPGKPTYQFLSRKILFFGIFSGIMIDIIVGVPLILALYRPEYKTFAMLPGLYIMLTSIVLTIMEEIRKLRMGRYYKSIFEEKKGRAK